MRNLVRRLARLEARLTDGSGCVPHSEAWFTYWTRQAERLLAGENVTKPPLAFFDALLASPGEAEEQRERAMPAAEVAGGGEHN